MSRVHLRFTNATSPKFAAHSSGQSGMETVHVGARGIGRPDRADAYDPFEPNHTGGLSSWDIMRVPENEMQCPIRAA